MGVDARWRPSDVEAFGDRVVAHGHWRTTGRLSGVEGTDADPHGVHGAGWENRSP